MDDDNVFLGGRRVNGDRRCAYNGESTSPHPGDGTVEGNFLPCVIKNLEATTDATLVGGAVDNKDILGSCWDIIGKSSSDRSGGEKV